MAARQAQTQQQPLAPLVLPASLAAAGVAGWFGFPSIVAIWVGLVVAAFGHPPPELTGRKDPLSGQPSPAGPGEQSKLQSYRFWSSVKTRVLVPSSGWLPGWPVTIVWLTAVVTALAAVHLPVNVSWFRWINAAAAFLSVVGVAQARRETIAEGDVAPATAVGDVIATASTTVGKVTLAAGVLAGAATGFVVTRFVTVTGMTIAPAAPNDVLLLPPDLPVFASRWALAAAAAWLVWLFVAGKTVSTVALSHWREVVAARDEWGPRWIALLKAKESSPWLMDRQHLGPGVIDSFAAPSDMGAVAFWPIAEKIRPTVGAGGKVVVLETEDTDSDGQPMPGTVHPLNFDVAMWPSPLPDITDVSVDPAVAAGVVLAAFVSALEEAKMGRPMQLEFEALHDEDSETAAWATKWAWPNGPGYTAVRDLAGTLAGSVGAQVLVDHRATAAAGLEPAIYVGALTDGYGMPAASMDEKMAAHLRGLEVEDTWRGRWSQVMKQGHNPPTIQHATFNEKELADGATVSQQAFTTRVGQDPAEFIGLEDKLATALGAAPFVSVTVWTDRGDRAGARHKQAIAVRWSNDQIPSRPENLAPSDAARWVLEGRVNEAFDNARMARPEVTMASALTSRDSRKHIWMVGLRLYGGVTLTDVRSKLSKLQTSFGTDWVRVAESSEGATLYMGAKPSRVKLARESRDRLRLESLDWEQAWVDANIVSANGQVPGLEEMESLPSNEDVKKVRFSLPAGVDPRSIKGNLERLKVSTGNVFMQMLPTKTASSATLLVSQVNPLPEMVPVDFDLMATGEGIPFATGVDGEPVEWVVGDAPHLFVAGSTGSGKSVVLQSILLGAALRGWSSSVVDPMKGAADFKFAESHLSGAATTVPEAAALMRRLYEEVERRKNLNSKYGVNGIDNLPEDERPSRMLIIIDEFTSLIGKVTIPSKSDDPEIAAERERLIAEQDDRSTIGTMTGKVAREARSAGVHLVLATQKMSSKTLDSIPGGSDLKTNLARCLMGNTSQGDRMSGLRDPMNAPPLDETPVGRGIYEPLNAPAKIVHAWFSTSDEMEQKLDADTYDHDDWDFKEYLRDDSGPVAGEIIRMPADDDDDDEIVDLGEMTFDLDDDWGDDEAESVPTDDQDDDLELDQPFEMDDGPAPDRDMDDEEFGFDEDALPADPDGASLDFGLDDDDGGGGDEGQAPVPDDDPWGDDDTVETEAPQPTLEPGQEDNPWDDGPRKPQQATETATPPAEPVDTDTDDDPWGDDAGETNGQAPTPNPQPELEPETEPTSQPGSSSTDDADTVIVAVQVDAPAVDQALLGNHDGDVESLLGWLDEHRDIRKVVWIDRDRDRRNQASEVLKALDFEVLVLAKPDPDVVEGWLSLEDEFV